jgi:predicted DNA-binding protein with PD1-like motif
MTGAPSSSRRGAHPSHADELEVESGAHSVQRATAGTGIAVKRVMKTITLDRQADHRRTFAFVFVPDEDPVALTAGVASELRLASCQITAVGGFSRATLGYFDHERREYLRIPIAEQVEVLSLLGDIAHDDEGKRIVHVHCVVGLRDGTTRGGHLLEARVRPTLEMIVTEWPTHLRKRFDPAIGLALIDPPTRHG